MSGNLQPSTFLSVYSKEKGKGEEVQRDCTDTGGVDVEDTTGAEVPGWRVTQGPYNKGGKKGNPTSSSPL